MPAGSRRAAQGYANPLRDARASFGRVDQGVDYAGTGPVHALGPGVIEATYNSGWQPGGAFIDEHLTGGPLAGSDWYVAEQITPAVQAGQRVDDRTVIGQMYGGIETGYAAPAPYNTGESLAHYQGHYAFPTPEGQQAERLLSALGAPKPGHGATGHVGGTGTGTAGGGGFGWNPLNWPGQFAGQLTSGIQTAVIVGPLVLAGAGLALWGFARMTGLSARAQEGVQQAQDKAGQAGQAAAVAA